MSFDSNSTGLIEYFEGRKLEILEFLRWLVGQESMSGSAEAITSLAEEFSSRLSELGASIELLNDPRAGASLIARFGSSGPERSGKQLLVLGHIDTVWPLGTTAVRPFRIEDGRAYGPGTFDMKAGLAIAFFAMKAIVALGRTTARPVTFLFNADEETGSESSRALIEQEARKTEATLVLEPPIPGGKLKTGRKGVGIFELIARGRSAHAGNDPSRGVNAITEIAHQILAINELASPSLGTTLSVGVIKGGVLSNVVPAESRALIDLRYSIPEEGERIAGAFSRLTPRIPGASLEVKGGVNRQPLVRTPEIANLFAHASRLAAELGFEIGEGSVGGASDGNLVAALGVPVLDGLGVDGLGAHAEHEHIIIDDIPRRAALLMRLLETV
ncbi:MAG TPA: M20 family metallopeptidase [Blastocatellia bacterium]